ncbi:hypothetical protein T265_09715 [Opisthorchis viverrini]|uniref:Uncharacterized protein n=1 Tax=Opisthorchis viverrini TaxID=6198 RepID=A0A074Z4Y1_OPIVI|nr:hypothetical protein T265_09715 [Opisthorchis viverrini]KER22118.1 hypothetical protein T265_09715 [Opisthorchis viverrini]
MWKSWLLPNKVNDSAQSASLTKNTCIRSDVLRLVTVRRTYASVTHILTDHGTFQRSGLTDNERITRPDTGLRFIPAILSVPLLATPSEQLQIIRQGSKTLICILFTKTEYQFSPRTRLPELSWIFIDCCSIPSKCDSTNSATDFTSLGEFHTALRMLIPTVKPRPETGANKDMLVLRIAIGLIACCVPVAIIFGFILGRRNYKPQRAVPNNRTSHHLDGCVTCRTRAERTHALIGQNASQSETIVLNQHSRTGGLAAALLQISGEFKMQRNDSISDPDRCETVNPFSNIPG